MKKAIKTILKSFIPPVVLKQRLMKQEKDQYEAWTKNGCPVPSPHIVKQLTIKEYQQKYKCNTLIETGTYLGDMVEAQKETFAKIISIELGIDLFEKAKKRFIKSKHIQIIQGDSGKVLSSVLKDLNEDALFWLDGHYSAGITAKGNKDCPIFEELDAILNGNKFNHVLLIDDARCFNGEGDYPSIEKLTAYIKSKNEHYKAEVKHDIIRYVI